MNPVGLAAIVVMVLAAAGIVTNEVTYRLGRQRARRAALEQPLTPCAIEDEIPPGYRAPVDARP